MRTKLKQSGISWQTVEYSANTMSPLLVDRGKVLEKVRGIQYLERGRENVVLIDPLNLWRAEVSYIVTRGLDI